jgi:hypothetical protein
LSSRIIIKQKTVFWVKEKKQSSAEVDLAISFRDKITR